METLLLFGSSPETQSPVGSVASGRRRGRRRRRNTSANSSREERRKSFSSSITNDASISSTHEGKGTGIEYSDSGEDSSEMEWLDWRADLHRQERVRKEQQHQARDDSSVTLHEQRHPIETFSQTQAHDQRRFLEDRRALEPSGVVTSYKPNPPPSEIAHAQSSVPLSLSSPSSYESLGERERARVLSFGFSPIDPPSSATSPTHSRSHSRSHSQIKTPPPILETSQYDWTGAANMSAQELHSLRRPSMPTISSTFAVAPGTGSGSTSIFQPRSLMVTGPVSSPRGLDASVFPVGVSSVPSGSNSIPRRASTAGIASVAGGSMGRSFSILGRGTNLLRKKDSGSLSFVDKEKAKRQDEKVAAILGVQSQPKPARPRLSLSASSRQSLNQTISQGSCTTSPTSTRPPVVRRVKSGSSLLSNEDVTTATENTWKTKKSARRG